MPGRLLRVAEWGFFDSSTSLNNTQQPQATYQPQSNTIGYQTAQIQAQALRVQQQQSSFAQSVASGQGRRMGFKKALWFNSELDLWDPSSRFQTSWLLPPWLLFVCRFLIGLYALVTRIISISYRCTHPNLSPTDEGGCPSALQSFSYFTILTYWGLAFYFLISSVHTLFYTLRGRSPLESFPRWLQALHSLFYTTIVVFPFIVTIVYWAILYKGVWFENQFVAWENVSQHGLNSAFALFEIFLTRTDTPLWVHLPWLLIILAGYLGLAFVTLATQGFYTYSFLDHDVVGGRGYVAAYVAGILLGVLIVFAVVWGLIWTRKWVTETRWGRKGKLAQLRSWRGDIERGTPMLRQSPSMKQLKHSTSQRLKQTTIGVAY